MSGGWLRKVVMAEHNSVGYKGGICGGFEYLEAEVVFPGRANEEAVAGAEGPGGTGGGLVVDENRASDGAEVGLNSSHVDVRGAAVDWRRRLSDSSA